MRIRWLLALFCCVLFLGIVGYTIQGWEPVTVANDIPLNELIKAGIQLKVEQSRSEFQLALLILGALWALMIAKKGEAKIVLSDRPELIMFCCASLLLLLSCGHHLVYIEEISYIYSLAGGINGGNTIPDVFGSAINNPYGFQLWALIGGGIASALTLLSAHQLK